MEQPETPTPSKVRKRKSPKQLKFQAMIEKMPLVGEVKGVDGSERLTPMSSATTHFYYPN